MTAEQVRERFLEDLRRRAEQRAERRAKRQAQERERWTRRFLAEGWTPPGEDRP